MKKITLIAALLISTGLCLAETIPATDGRISCIGRCLPQDTELSFDWSATTLRLNFHGSRLELKCSDTHADYFNLWIDKEQCAVPDRVICVKSDTTICLFKGKKGNHSIIFQKRTEGEQGTFTAKEFSTDGNFLPAPKRKGRLIEFIGDSYTCGYGTEAPSRDCPFLPETENPSLTYADILGRFFDAETVHISHSGRGIVRNYDDYNQSENMVKFYSQTFDQHSEEAWEGGYRADLVVIYLGTNDFSCGKQPNINYWCDNYGILLQKVRAFHPGVPVICMASKADPLMGYYVRRAVEKSGLDNVHCLALSDKVHNEESDLGASWHPNYNGHRKVASVLAPYISTVMNWDFPAKVLE